MPGEAHQKHVTLAHLAAEGAGVPRIAETALMTWRQIDVTLSPILGQRGVAALYKRSLYLTRTDHPWLAEVYEGALPLGEFTSLHTAMSQQTSIVAADGNDALLKTFCDLLADLIGGTLTERLLRSVWDKLSSGDAVLTSGDAVPETSR